MDPGNPRLLDTIRAEIASHGPMSFRRFMELALYEPEHGYYASRADRLGPDGDFVTAGDAGPAFGRCLARQLSEFDALLERPERFRLIELGAGRGLLARDVLDAAQELDAGLARRLSVTLVDRSAAMRAEAAGRVPEAVVLEQPQPDEAGRGCAVAVELFDALPVSRLRRRGERLVEVLVDVDRTGALVELEGAPDEETRALAERHGAAPNDGDEAEVSTELPRVLAAMASTLGRGFLVIVDYGHSAERLYDGRHRRGTLLAYHRHETNEDYLARVGRQDLTAHVNFSALEEAAHGLGLVTLGRTTQDRFLIANGLIELFEPADPSRVHDVRLVRQRLQAMQLIHPHAMGRRFQVLVIGKGLDRRPSLRGLRDPFA